MGEISKASFVEELKNFYINVAGNPEGISDLIYVRVGHDEFVYVSWKSFSQKRFCVTGDSLGAIMNDFCRFMSNQDSYRWLSRDEMV